MHSSPTLDMSARAHVRVAHQNHFAAYIQRSHDRCIGLDPVLSGDPDPMCRADLEVRRAMHHDLLLHAAPEIASLEALVSAARSVVVLADSNGLILQQHGCKQFLDKARRVALLPGVSWAESLRGTNAIGTALLEKRAVRVHGSEHFLTCNHILGCDAAPVWSGTGEILGVLDLTGPASQRQTYAWGLVQAHAANISNRLLDSSRLRRLVFHTDMPSLEAAHRAIILIDDADCIAGANLAALTLLDTDWTLIGAPLEQWLDGATKVGRHAEPIQRHDGTPLVGVVQSAARSAVRTRFDPGSLKIVSPGFDDVVPDPTFLTLRDQGVRAIAAGLSVLLHGETGTGKEVLAREIHQHSIQKSGRFVAINCGALPESLIESELFGYEAGAFTGARREGARGLLAQADGGVLFLDEIADMPMGLQTRLLRVLQEREVQPLGSEKRIALEFGVISASHQNLEQRVRQGHFRSDLYYRLQGLQLSVPALCERPDLASFFSQQAQQLALSISAEALAMLCNYDWPGNYREMQSVLRRLPCQYPDIERVEPWMLPSQLQARAPHQAATVYGQDTSCTQGKLHTQPQTAPQWHAAEGPLQQATGGDVSVPGKTAASLSGTGISLQHMEQQTILRVLGDCGGNITRAAQRLGIHRSTLHRKLRFLDATAQSATRAGTV